MFQIKLDNKSRRGLFAIKQIDKRVKFGIRSAFFDIGKDLKKDTRASILDKNKNGRTYRIKTKKGFISHRASAPGEAPANLTGALQNSVTYKVRGSDEMEFGYRGGMGGIKYGKYLELGVKKGAATGEVWRIAPRPALWMNIEKNIRNMQIKFEKNIKKQLSK